MDASSGLDLTALGGLIRDAGVIGLLGGAIIAGLRGWVRTDREFQDERQDKMAAIAERDEWKTLALELLRQNDRATAIAERVVGNG